MGVNVSRSMNHDLSEGMTDGKYKKATTSERGGLVDPATAASRQHLLPLWYGTGTEAPMKIRPDGKPF